MNGDRGTSHRAANSSGKGPPRETWRFASSSLVIAAAVITLSSLRADDGPRNSTKKMATFEAPAKQQTDADAQKSKKIAATVRLPNGNPAVGAQVVLYWDAAQVRWDAKQFRLVFDRVSPSTRSATDGAGHFQLTTPSDDFWIAVAHPSGFLRRRFGPDTVPAVIELVPWGRVEGTLRVGRKLQPNIELSIQLENSDQHGPHDPWFWASHTAMTDAAGHFVFEHVVPGRATISKSLRSRFKRDFPNSSAVYAILVQAGQTTQINLGNSGRPVVGQLRVPPNSDVKVETGFASIVVCEDIPQPHEPRQFQATVDDRGNFCIDDVFVGSYWMSVITRPSGRFIDVFRFQFTVPPINEKLSQRPVDLGIRTVDLRNPH